jgi:hypothetical protein
MKRIESYEYHAYLLRLWREEKVALWRASLENTHTGERRNFASLEKLLSFIEEQTGEELRVKK